MKTMSKKLNLGCGPDYRKGYINCDINPKMNPDLVMDLEEALPFKDNSIDFVLAESIWEHLNNRVHFIEEIHRVLKPKGKTIIKVPHYKYPSAWADVTHKFAFHPMAINPFLNKFKLIKTKCTRRRFMKWIKPDIIWILEKK